ncbi:hypothetical protein EDD71_103116 [Fonticella tunisiensis]|uniref:DUF5050 domain-containing protein n=1 Tax=Fonticella tunisiensis TaxID=1096341 RepID=A0A4R7KVT9_9CLOT|nr:hypothetical protein EDD71_103116 [Fonticella tunisiensis]
MLWTDCIDNQGYYIIYDLNTSEIKKYKSEFRYPGYARLSNNKIYSINFHDFSSWRTNELGVYDLSTGKYTRIKSEHINGFNVYKDTVCVKSNEDLLEIYKNENGEIHQVKNLTEISRIDSISFSHKGDLIVGRDALTPDSNAEIYLLDIKYIIKD